MYRGIHTYSLELIKTDYVFYRMDLNVLTKILVAKNHHNLETLSVHVHTILSDHEA